MKKTILGFALVIILGFHLRAQIGHLDLDALKSDMPEITDATAELGAYRARLQAQGEGMVRELQAEYARVEKLVSCGSTITKEVKEKMIAPLKIMEEEIHLFERYMIAMVESKEAELFDPILEGIDIAIKEVALENKFEAIINQGSPMILYSNSSSDIKTLVSAKLGLQVQSNEVAEKKSGFDLQAQKIGHLNLAAIKSDMVEIAEAKSKLEAYGVELQKEQEKMMADLRKEYARYEKYAGHFSNKKKEAMIAELKIKENEILLLDARMESMIQGRESELLRPIHDKIDAAIEAVALENEFQYILEESAEEILFKESTDVGALVIGRLGM